MLDQLAERLGLTRAQISAIATVIAAAIALLAAFGIGNTPAPTAAPPTSTVVTGTTGPVTLTTTDDAAADVAESEVGEHRNAIDESPEGVSLEALEAAAAQQREIAAANPLRGPPPDAAPQQAGCTSAFVANKSSRNGVRPKIWVAHYTVSPNRPGRTDINALTAYANNRASGVSWHYLMDRDGNCAYNVREADKAWTQATFNPVSISMEIINTGSERPLFTKAGLQKFARVVSDSAGRWGIPIRLGAVNTRTCTVTRPGIVDHNMLGACGGGHHDITPFDVRDLIAAVKAYRAEHGNEARKIAKWCRSLKIVRAKIRARTSNASQRSRGRQLKTLLIARDAPCV